MACFLGFGVHDYDIPRKDHTGYKLLQHQDQGVKMFT